MRAFDRFIAGGGAFVLIVLALLIGWATAHAAPLSASLHHTRLPYVLQGQARLDLTVKHSQKVVVWTQAWEPGGREFYWPVKLHPGRNRVRVSVLVVSFRELPPVYDVQRGPVWRSAVDLAPVTLAYVGVRRHSRNAPEMVDPVRVGNVGGGP